MDHMWKTIDELHAWLDGHAEGPPERTALLRVLKLSEEVGEVAQAVIGAYGQNPARGPRTRGTTSGRSSATWCSRRWWPCGR